ncbi:MAG: zinc ABC transporter substrate-binding protein [Deltaproteobacteria bacterium]|nr:zinc ABC transporter substrate-binding protein [Deltaproteobacteria bacterium]
MRIVLALLLSILLAAPAGATDRIRVVTTLPDLADWVREIGGDRVEVRSLLTGLETPHTYEPRVSDVKAVAGSRVLVMVGLGLEEWVEGLVQNARNSELIRVEAARGVPTIQGGDHDGGGGNPHVWLDPARAETMCRNIARALERADPFAGDYYEVRLQAYRARLRRVADRVRARVAALPDRRFLAYHPAWPYFAEGLGFELVGTVVEQPGRQPSARALARLIDRIRTEGIRVLVTEPQLPSKLPDLLHQETGIRVVTLSPLLGASPAQTYLELLERNAQTLIDALSEEPP